MSFWPFHRHKMGQKSIWRSIFILSWCKYLVKRNLNKNKNYSSEMVLSNSAGCWSGQQICAGKSRPLKISSVNRSWAYGQMKIARIGMFLLLSDFKLFSLKILDTCRLCIFDNMYCIYKAELLRQEKTMKKDQPAQFLRPKQPCLFTAKKPY